MWYIALVERREDSLKINQFLANSIRRKINLRNIE